MKLTVENLSLGYAGRTVVRDVSLEIDAGEMVAIVGPNGSGKSTLLRGMSRIQRPISGRVLLGGTDIRTLSPREVARTLAILPQSPGEANDLTVRELVWRGRYPHQGILQRPHPADFEAVTWAMAAADVTSFANRPLGQLSGGERQRAWIALALAQQPKVFLLDEPTSFLDISHQLEVMHLLRRLNHQGMTVVAVLHDLTLAGRHADRIIAVRDGQIALDGKPSEVLTAETLEPVFGVPMMVIPDPITGAPLPLPRPDPRYCVATPSEEPAPEPA